MKFKLKYFMLAFCIISVAFIAFAIYAWKHGWEEMRKMDCPCNIKQIMVSLQMYAEKNDGWFPDKNGVQGLEIIRNKMREDGYLVNAPHLFNCPSVQPTLKNEISYDYIAGYRIDSDKNIGIVMDRTGNHKDFGNIGFVDGRVLSFSGKDWKKNAENKKK